MEIGKCDSETQASYLAFNQVLCRLRINRTHGEVNSNYSKAYLKLMGISSEEKQRFWLNDHFSIGRFSDNNLSIRADHLLSRKHAVIVKVGNSYFMEDLLSTNGTFINCKKISQKTQLHSGDKIFVGSSLLVFWQIVEMPLPISCEFNGRDQTSVQLVQNLPMHTLP